MEGGALAHGGRGGRREGGQGREGASLGLDLWNVELAAGVGIEEAEDRLGLLARLLPVSAL